MLWEQTESSTSRPDLVQLGPTRCSLLRNPKDKKLQLRLTVLDEDGNHAPAPSNSSTASNDSSDESTQQYFLPLDKKFVFRRFRRHELAGQFDAEQEEDLADVIYQFTNGEKNVLYVEFAVLKDHVSAEMFELILALGVGTDGLSDGELPEDGEKIKKCAEECGLVFGELGASRVGGGARGWEGWDTILGGSRVRSGVVAGRSRGEVMSRRKGRSISALAEKIRRIPNSGNLQEHAESAESSEWLGSGNLNSLSDKVGAAEKIVGKGLDTLGRVSAGVKAHVKDRWFGSGGG